jgi:hypothetical protein
VANKEVFKIELYFSTPKNTEHIYSNYKRKGGLYGMKTNQEFSCSANSESVVRVLINEAYKIKGCMSNHATRTIELAYNWKLTGDSAMTSN